MQTRPLSVKTLWPFPNRGGSEERAGGVLYSLCNPFTDSANAPRQPAARQTP